MTCYVAGCREHARGAIRQRAYCAYHLAVYAEHLAEPHGPVAPAGVTAELGDLSRMTRSHGLELSTARAVLLWIAYDCDDLAEAQRAAARVVRGGE